MGSASLGVLRLVGYGLLTLSLIPVQAVVVLLAPPRFHLTIPVSYHRLCARILGLDIRIHGQQLRDAPALFVCNHLSYLDITVLGAVIRASFVAKSEVSGWPLFGILAKLQKTVFVDRRRSSTGRQRNRLAERLEAGDRLIVFPEGTSGDGNRTLRFKSALFAVASARPGADADPGSLKVQPVSIACTALDGLPIGRAFRSAYAWYGDMDMAPHIWEAVGLGQIRVDVVFHQPVTLKDIGTRKALADHCWNAVATGVSQALAGRLTPGRRLIR